MRSLFGFMLIVGLLIGGTVLAADVKSMDGLVSSEVNGWKGDGKDGWYDRTNLYDYINGGAEVYLAYAYKSAFARRFEKADQPAITVDLFDMGTSEDAFGIFSFEREGKSVGIGQDSEYSSGFLRFWKGRYFVSILADKETPESREAVMSLGRSIAEQIKDAGTRPKIVDLLPANNLVPTSTRFFHQKSGLDYHFMLADKNILNLSAKTDVLLAKFKTPVRRNAKTIPTAQLLIARYPVEKDAAAAYTSFLKAYMPEAKADGAVKTENGKFTVARRSGQHIVVVFDAPDTVFAGALIDSIVGKIEVKPK